MFKVYDIDIIPMILNEFKVSNIVLSGLSDEKMNEIILNPGAADPGSRLSRPGQGQRWPNIPLPERAWFLCGSIPQPGSLTLDGSLYPNPRPLSWWCYPIISSSVVPFSSHLQSFPASGSFQIDRKSVV